MSTLRDDAGIVQGTPSPLYNPLYDPPLGVSLLAHAYLVHEQHAHLEQRNLGLETSPSEYIYIYIYIHTYILIVENSGPPR